MAAGDLAATVRALADKEAIRELTSRYAHHVWRQEPDLVAELFTEDGEMDTSLEEPIRGRPALREALARLIAGADLQPFVHNHIIEVDGNTASGVCYIDLRSVREGESMVGSGYYTDRYLRVDGEWKFQSRALTLRHFVPLDQGWAEPQG